MKKTEKIVLYLVHDNFIYIDENHNRKHFHIL